MFITFRLYKPKELRVKLSLLSDGLASGGHGLRDYMSTVRYYVLVQAVRRVPGQEARLLC